MTSYYVLEERMHHEAPPTMSFTVHQLRIYVHRICAHAHAHGYPRSQKVGLVSMQSRSQTTLLAALFASSRPGVGATYG